MKLQKHHRFLTIAASAVLYSMTAFQSLAETIFVSASSFSDGPGTTWSNAFHNIQAAVDAAADNDTVLVTNGVYSQGGIAVEVDEWGSMSPTNRVYLSKPVTVLSVNGAQDTVIVGAADPATGSGPAAVRCVMIVTNAVLSGFTLTNGHTRLAGEVAAAYGGGGAYVSGGGVVSDCLISDCSALIGGGICCNGETAVEMSQILNSTALGGGGGVYTEGAATLTGCLIAGNQAQYAGGGVETRSGGTVSSCTIVNNTSIDEAGGGIFCVESTTVLNTVITLNTAAFQDVNWSVAGTGITCTYCCTPSITGLPGSFECITNAPGFLDAPAGDYRLSVDSWCANNGFNQSWMQAASDLDGYSRIIDGRVDIGAYEVAAPAFIRITNKVSAVYGETVTYAPEGVAGGWIVGEISWSNATTGAGATLPAASPWQAPAIELIFGPNDISVCGTNIEGTAYADQFTITRYYEHGTNSPVHYVSNTGGSVYPYTSWTTAATNIQNAVNAATSGDTVLLTNGTYDAISQVLVAKDITLTSVNGASETIVDGQHTHRCIYLSDGVVEQLTIQNGRAEDGGGICMTGGTIRNCLILNNDAPNDTGGGGLYCSGGIAEYCTISGNDSFDEGAGGGVYCTGNALIQHCTITLNEANGGDGGGLHCAGGATVRECNIYDNLATFGGGVYCRGTGSRVEYCNIDSNVGLFGAGGLSESEGTISHCTLWGNTGGAGGGIYCFSNGKVEDSIIRHNGVFDSVNCMGGGVYMSGGEVRRCQIYSNRGEDLIEGGGAYLTGGVMVNCRITANVATEKGGGVFIERDAEVRNCTISGNYSGDEGGGIYINESGTVQNSILWFNNAFTSGSEWTDAGVSTWVNCCTTPSKGVSCVTSDPLLDVAYRLLSASPCIDTGANSLTADDADGVPRPLDGDNSGSKTCDIGAYEFIHPSADSDSDTIPDCWEVDHGMNPIYVLDKYDNFDSDPYINLDEWVADTDPRDGSSFPCIVDLAGWPRKIYFNSSADREYTLYYKTDLTTGAWQVVPGQQDIAGNGTLDWLTDTSISACRYYKITVKLP